MLFLLNALKNRAFNGAVSALPLIERQSVGHSVTQAFTTGTDVPYQAVTGAVKSCISHAITTNHINKSPTGRFNQVYATLIFPVVVIEGKLFECSSQPDDTFEIREVQRSAIKWKGNTDSDIMIGQALVHIVTKEHLPEFVRMLDATAAGIINATNVLRDLLDQTSAELLTEAQAKETPKAKRWGKKK